jgi:hypothetical protein
MSTTIADAISFGIPGDVKVKEPLHITLQGTTDDKGTPTIIDTSITVCNGLKLTLRNLTFRNHNHSKIKILDDGQCRIEDCTIENGSTFQHPVVHAQGTAIVHISGGTINGGTIKAEGTDSGQPQLTITSVTINRTEGRKNYRPFEILDPVEWIEPNIVATNSKLTLKGVSIEDSNDTIHSIPNVEDMVVDDEYDAVNIIQETADTAKGAGKKAPCVVQ